LVCNGKFVRSGTLKPFSVLLIRWPKLCTEESLNVLRQAEALGYALGVEKDKTFSVTRNGTSYLRSNDDIQRFGRFAKISSLSFREPMNFPKGTTLYETRGPRVAVLPDYSLVTDDGHVFQSADEYRKQTGDREAWDLIWTS
jgi:hypothetical protein